MELYVAMLLAGAATTLMTHWSLYYSALRQNDAQLRSAAYFLVMCDRVTMVGWVVVHILMLVDLPESRFSTQAATPAAWLGGVAVGLFLLAKTLMATRRRGCGNLGGLDTDDLFGETPLTKPLILLDAAHRNAADLVHSLAHLCVTPAVVITLLAIR